MGYHVLFVVWFVFVCWMPVDALLRASPTWTNFAWCAGNASFRFAPIFIMFYRGRCKDTHHVLGRCMHHVCTPCFGNFTPDSFGTASHHQCFGSWFIVLSQATHGSTWGHQWLNARHAMLRVLSLCPGNPWEPWEPAKRDLGLDAKISCLWLVVVFS